MATSGSKNTKEEFPVEARKPDKDPDDDDDYSSSDEEDDDLVLEGVIIRNPDVSDSDDTSSEEEEGDGDDGDESEKKPPPKKKAKVESSDKVVNMSSKVATMNKKKNKKRTKEPGPEILNVDFVFCDMNEKFFHGLKTMLTATSPVYAAQSSPLADLMIENVSVGTVTSTEGDEEGTVFGYASVLNLTTFQDRPCIQALKKICTDQCPDQHKQELDIVLSGKTKRPAGFYLHGRMVNMPLEIVQVLHEQLVLDMDWAVENAEGGLEMRKSLDFGAFVRIAPSYRASGVSYYRLFDDEIFATHAEFTYEIELPKTFGMDEKPYATVIVLTKSSHRAAMKELTKLVAGGGPR